MNNCDLFSILSLKYQRWIKFSTSAHDKQLIAYRKGDKSAETEGGGGGGVVGVPGGVLYMSQIFNRSNKYPAWWGGGVVLLLNHRQFPNGTSSQLCLYISQRNYHLQYIYVSKFSQRNYQPCYVSRLPNKTTSQLCLYSWSFLAACLPLLYMLMLNSRHT